MRIWGLLVLAVVAALSWASYWVSLSDERLTQPLAADQSVYTVANGARLGTVLADLEARGWIEQAPDARIVSRLHPNLVAIKAGTFAVPDTLDALLQRIVAGQPINYYFTIVPGWNLWQLQQALADESRLTKTLPADLTQWAERFDGPDWLEGQFLPDTYAFAPGTSDEQLLLRAQQALEQVLTQAWAGRKTQQLQSPEALLTLASIIEKETAVASERRHIAGVFDNRLRRGMRLQTDPTVIYGLLPDFNGNITRRNLREKTPYNTYQIDGLPPTPIAMASRESIMAAADPLDTPHLFFVATGDGGHAFAETNAEHERNVRAYLKRLRETQ